MHCARERERWSNGVRQAREEQYQAEISVLKRQLAELAGERDAARRQLQQADTLRQRFTDISVRHDAAQQQLREARALQQQLADLTAERDAAREQLQQAQELRDQLGELTTQRDAAQQQLEQLEHALARATAAASRPAPRAERPSAASLPGADDPQSPRGLRMRAPYRAATAAGVVLSLGMLANGLIYQDAQSTVQAGPEGQDAGAASLMTLESRLDADRDLAAEDSQTTPPPQTRKPKTRFVRSGSGELHQWGPPLLPDHGKELPTRGFDEIVQRQQQGLLALGFDIGKADGFTGPRTRQALEEFRSLYLSGLEKPPTGSALAAIIKNYADLARSDARNFGVDQGVLAAIRLSSVRTGIGFPYLMKLAAVESNFDPVSKSSASSATGLYQFTRDTWLNTIKAHGENYGLAEYAGKIEYTVDRNGYQRPQVRDKAAYKHLMALRKNPRVSAMMAAESVKDNRLRLTRSFDRQPSEADLYLTHFFGTDGAISFLKALDKTPDAFAVDIFPAAAQSNQDIFHPRTCKPRTVDEVYELFGQKFNRWQFGVATN